MKDFLANIIEKAEKKQHMVEAARVIKKPKLTVKRISLNSAFEEKEDDLDKMYKWKQIHLGAMQLQN